MIDRSEVSRALAKAIAYKQCGKDEEARAWARELVQQLQCAEILVPARREDLISRFTPVAKEWRA